MREVIAAEVAKALRARLTRAAAEKVEAAITETEGSAEEIERIAAEEAAAQLAGLAAAAAVGPDEDGAQDSPVFDDVFDWVFEFLIVAYWRDTDTSEGRLRWCEQWWAHPEALSRLTALWELWEEVRAVPMGMLRWWKEADQQMGKLLAADGPFVNCGSRSHGAPTVIRSLPYVDPPEEIRAAVVAARVP